MQGLSVVIISLNEADCIGRCIRSVKAVADEVILIDSFSDDSTVKIAQDMGAIVKQSRFDGYINQKNKAINLASHNWVLLLDADEALSDELAASIMKVKKRDLPLAYSMNRCSHFCGKFIRRGLWYPDRKLRLFNKKYGICGGMDPHDRIIMQEGIRSQHLKGDLLHYSFDSLEEYLDRNQAVSTISAQSLYDAGIKKNWIKLVFSPLWAFINGYFFRLGFLDGTTGLVISWHTAHQSYSKYLKLKRMHEGELKKIIWGKT